MLLLQSPSASVARPVRQSAVAALAQGEIAGLDGLRAISVVCVMIAHYGFGSILPGGLGVTVFFFISGFLITTLMLREAHATGGVAIGRFYARRFLRLQPELWALLFVSGIGGILFGTWPHTLDVMGGLFYFSNYILGGVFNGGHMPVMRWQQLWSIAVEEHYYLTYPLLFVALMKAPARLMAVLVAVLVGALALRFGYYWNSVNPDYIYAATETRIDSVAYGCVGALALWYLPARAADFIGNFRTVIAGMAILLIVASIVIRWQMMHDTLRYSMQGVALLLLSCSLHIGSADALGVRLLETPVLRWMGRMSYGAYLWHLEVGGGIERLLHLPPQLSPSWLAAAEAPILIAISFGVAYLSFELFQKPLVGLRLFFGGEARAKAYLAVTKAVPPGETSPIMKQC